MEPVRPLSRSSVNATWATTESGFTNPEVSRAIHTDRRSETPCRWRRSPGPASSRLQPRRKCRLLKESASTDRWTNGAAPESPKTPPLPQRGTRVRGPAPPTGAPPGSER
ncbi:hypothetical protein HPB50_019277 [Hyalomma asiaticum]|uniref:Uncharacterized protein n=1 Tax=Hyalomma asiaticum TaxID=266040 RepID=A0ACB7RXG2_HYAAI|nr:hypothetical protein HPB50_019277 [Hyalomma asiaticum]